ncbi:putative glycerophosphoryl diester phosphodiesterase [Babesia divergens]|uniref:Glycerophosphoryl diester phosphodiesterase n=1 Tax=Babesia divergens TaxID=32595 RepID=A0AAD9GCV3_BABDI|nr:putative glycerophosphoryl diester phosphodiesterase [Babesia divergens]
MRKVLIFGHRGMGCSIPGALSKFPENSLSAIREARRLGADGVELDVFLSKRGEILVLHGYLSTNSLCLTALPRHPSSGYKRISEEHLVEDVDISASDLLHRKPWALMNETTDEDEYMDNHRRDRKSSFHKYISSVEHFAGETIPTLDKVFEEFGDTIQYNIELKGTRPELGLRVLDVIERYPNVQVFISSFNWIPPKLSETSPHIDDDLEQLPNGEVTVDLLRPLVDNRLGVPIGLLFNNLQSRLPSIERICECAESFKAQWVNVAHEFWKSPNPLIGSSKTGVEALLHLVDELHGRGLKLLSYFLESQPDSEEDIKIQLDAGVDVVCANDVEAALTLNS